MDSGKYSGKVQSTVKVQHFLKLWYSIIHGNTFDDYLKILVFTG